MQLICALYTYLSPFVSSIFYQYLNNKILKTASLPQHEKSRHVFEKIFKYVVIEAIIAVLMFNISLRPFGDIERFTG